MPAPVLAADASHAGRLAWELLRNRLLSRRSVTVILAPGSALAATMPTSLPWSDAAGQMTVSPLDSTVAASPAWTALAARIGPTSRAASLPPALSVVLAELGDGVRAAEVVDRANEVIAVALGQTARRDVAALRALTRSRLTIIADVEAAR